jgi:hypothetical protein
MVKAGLSVLFLCAALLGYAQDTGVREAAITVLDGELDIPLEGARIVSWDGTEFLCDENGAARVSVPIDRPVIIKISYPGYESARVALRPGISAYTVQLRLGGVMEERELVIEAPRPGSSQTVSGRSVAISGRDLTLAAETGIIGDVMNAVKLLPGVGYVGGYMAMPSVRGGEPNDVTAVFDGFYVERPYHWGGAFSIFDPKMVESAQLSHGVFSVRYGHTISGLLDIHAKHPSPETAGLDLAVSTSAANLNLSVPLGANGAAALMGKVTYWDPFVEFAKLFFEEVRYVTTAPYIRSTALAGSYNVSSDLSISLNGFFGGDGAGASYDEDSDFNADFSWDNKIGFISSGLVYSPGADIVIKGRLGAGLNQSDLNAETYSLNTDNGNIREMNIFTRNRTANVQGRFDLDKDLGGGFLFAAGLEERYSRWDRQNRYDRRHDNLYGNDPPETWERDGNVLNQGLATALYALLEYRPEHGNFGMELGLRGDHFFLSGADFTLNGIPSVQPRVNFDVGILRDKGPVEKAALTFGTGLFSSVNTALQNVEGRNNLDAWADTQNQSWTSVAGTKFDFFGGYTFTLETYFKYVFNRSYTQGDRIDTGDGTAREYRTNYFFDGEALIWGFDLMLQKFHSRYWDGWISYSYINAKYRDPESASLARNDGGWYYPSFHRFHTLNLIVNYKPAPAVQLTTRFSLASGTPIPETVAILGPTPPDTNYSRIQAYSDNSRSGLVIPLDIKLSLFGFNKNGKVKRELYFSFENLLSLAYHADGPKDFDSNTGKETPSSIASYDLPIPLITFGIKWSY